MSLIPPPRQRLDSTLSVRLPQALKDDLDQYCAYAQCGRQHVVEQAMRRLLAEDSHFRLWREQQIVAAPLAKGHSA